MNLTRRLIGWRSPAGPRGRLTILIFHRVLDAPDPLAPGEVDRQRFDRVCGWLRTWFDVLPLDVATRRLAAGDLPARALSITFDDGYEDNHRHALPVLQRHGLTATFFIASGYLDGGCMWNDVVVEAVRRTAADAIDLDGIPGGGSLPLRDVAQRRAAISTLLPRLKYLAPGARRQAAETLARRAGVAIPGDLMMRSSQVQALRRAGMQIGAHTATHPILARLADDDARREIVGGKSALETLLGERVGLFAYPNGKPVTDYGASTVRIVREAGFDAAVSTAWGTADADSDPYQLPRFTPWDRSRLRFGARLISNLNPAATDRAPIPT